MQNNIWPEPKKIQTMILLQRSFIIFYVVVLSTFTPINLYAQKNEFGTYGLKLNGIIGYHFASNTVAKTNMNLSGIVSGFDISLLKNGLNADEFSSTFGNPLLSLNIKYFQMNRPDTFGKSLGIYPSYDLPVFVGKKLKLAARIGYGVNFNTVQYHRQKNFDNRAISSAVNFAFDLGTSIHYRITPQLQVELNGGLYHVSNGSLKMPNGGLNILYASLGSCFFFEKQGDYIKPNYTLNEKRWHISSHVSFGYRELGYFDYVTQFWVANMSINPTFSVNKLYEIGVGVDGFYDATQSLLYETKLRVRDVKEREKYHLALGLYQRFNLGKLFVPFGIYKYLAPISVIKEKNYIRFGLGYQFHKILYTGLFFKGTINKKQQLQSDFMECSIGIRF